MADFVPNTLLLLQVLLLLRLRPRTTSAYVRVSGNHAGADQPHDPDFFGYKVVTGISKRSEWSERDRETLEVRGLTKQKSLPSFKSSSFPTALKIVEPAKTLLKLRVCDVCSGQVPKCTHTSF